MNDINSKIRKVGLWAWNQKEKMFLAALLIVLCFRVYMLLANPPGVTAEQTPPKAPLHSTKTPGTTEGSMMVSANDVPEPPPRPVLERPDDFRPLVRQNPFTIYGAATGGKSSSDAEGDTIDVTLNNIVKWNDGTYRAELTTKVTGKPKRYKAGEEFENYKLMSIDPQNKTVTIYSTALGKTVELKMQ